MLFFLINLLTSIICIFSLFHIFWIAVMSLSTIRCNTDNKLITSGSGTKISQLYVNKMNDRENRRLRRRTLGFGENLHTKHMPLTYLTKNSNNNLNISDLIYNNLRRNANTSDNNNNNNNINNNNNNINNNNINNNNNNNDNNNENITNNKKSNEIYNLKLNPNINQITNNENKNLNPFEENNNEIENINTNEANNVTLSSQISQAKEMGYTDDEILKALKINNKIDTETKNLCDKKNSKQQNNFKPFISISEMVEALSNVQKCKNNLISTNDLAYRRKLYDRNPLSSTVNCLSSTLISKFRDDKNDLSDTKNLKLTPQISSIGRSYSFNQKKQADLATNKAKRNLTVDFGSPNARCNLLVASALSTKSSSLQRLTDTIDNDNRRRLEELQRSNKDLLRKLESSLIETERLRNSLRRKTEESERHTVQLKNLIDVQRRLEIANRRIEELQKDLKIRDLENHKSIIDMNALRYQYEVERRKLEETKNNLTVELDRLTRANAHAEEIFRENVTLKSEIKAKEELLNNIMISSTSSNINDNFQCSDSTANFESIDDEPSLISRTNLGICNRDDNGFQCVVEALSERIEKLEADNRELVERQTQGPTCGICMDNRREVIFMPCLHFTCCKSCSETMNHCSICRLRIMGKIEFFQ